MTDDADEVQPKSRTLAEQLVESESWSGAKIGNMAARISEQLGPRLDNPQLRESLAEIGRRSARGFIADLPRYDEPIFRMDIPKPEVVEVEPPPTAQHMEVLADRMADLLTLQQGLVELEKQRDDRAEARLAASEQQARRDRRETRLWQGASLAFVIITLAFSVLAVVG